MPSITIKGTGAFIASAHDRRRRPYRRGAEVLVDEDVARRLVASGAAVYSDEPGQIEQPVGITDDSTDEQIADATIDELLGYVGDDPARAGRVLAVEQAKDKPRKTLVEKLEEITGGDA